MSLPILDLSTAFVVLRTHITDSKRSIVTDPTLRPHSWLELRCFVLAPVILLSPRAQPWLHEISYLLQLSVVNSYLHLLIRLLVCLLDGLGLGLAILLDDLGLGLLDDCLLGHIGQCDGL